MRYLRPCPRRTAHPRSRGENDIPSVTLNNLYGSSPLTRGKPDWRRVRRIDDRLIPAHAGKTLPASCARSACWAHPRSREENLWEDRIRALEHGSSPLTRGKQLRVFDRELGRGLIPAHAGKTFASTPKSIHGEAHPRSRGENAQADYGSTVERGSSPLTRGKRERPCGVPPGGGLIPAHAGKTASVNPSRLLATAHPRSRGENPKPVAPPEPGWGSSPLTRGKPISPTSACRAGRLIPAHAGKTRVRSRKTYTWSAHPRSRGENSMSAVTLIVY